MPKKVIVLSAVVVVILAVVIVLAVKMPSSEPKVANNSLPNNTNNINNPVPANNSTNTTNTWEDANKPAQSSPIEDQNQIPEEAIKIKVTEQGITPASFEVKKGEKITLSVSSGDQWTHIFKFKSETLKDVAVGIGPKETRAISFFAPKEKGGYEYYCDVPGHIERGEKGTMTVK